MITKYNVTEQQQTLLTSLDLGLAPAGYRRFDLTAEQQKDVIDALVAMKPEATAGQKRIISTLLKRLGVTNGFTKRIRSGYFIENNYVDRLNFIAEMTADEQALSFSVTADGNLDCNDWLLANGRFISTANRASDLKMIPADVLRILNDNIRLHESRVATTVESLQAAAPAPAPKTQGVNLMDLIEETPAVSGPNLMDLIEEADAGKQGELFPEPEPVLAPLPVITAPMVTEWDEGPSQADLDEIEALDFLDASTDAPEEDTTEEEPEEELETVGLDEWLAAEEGGDDDADAFAMDDDHTFADTLTEAFSVRQARRCGFLISAIEQLEWSLIDDEQLLDADNEVVGIYDADAYTISFADMSAAEALGEEIKICADETYMEKQYAGDLDDDEERDWSRVNEEADIMIQG